MRARGSVLFGLSVLFGAWFLITGCGQVIGLEDSYTESGSTGVCVESGKSCTTNSGCCGSPNNARCVDFLDANNHSIGKQCTPTCTTDTDCGTGCCAPLDPSGQSTTLKVCALPNYCDDNGKVCASSAECHTTCCDPVELLCALPAKCAGN